MRFYLKHILLFVILTLHFKGLSQYAIAGTQGGFYTDVLPDTILTGVYNGSSETFYIDLNSDGANDVRISCASGGGLGGQNSDVVVAALQSYIKLSLGSIDSTPGSTFCGGSYFIRPVLKIYSQNDTIKMQNFAQATSAYIGYHAVLCGAWATSNQWVRQGDKYIGISYLDVTSSITYYGWIRVSVTSSSSCIIRDYSLFAPLSIQVNEVNEDLYSIKLYPNPSNEGIKCVLKEQNEEVKFTLSNISGKEIQVDFTMQGEGNYYIETKNVVDGIYFLEIDSNNKIVRKKIIVQH